MHKTFRMHFWNSFPTIGNRKFVLSLVEVSKIENGWGSLLSLSLSRCVGRGSGAADRENLPHRVPGWKHCFW